MKNNSINTNTISNLVYSINETSHAFGINNKEASSSHSLKFAFDKIKHSYSSKSKAEVITFTGKSQHSFISVKGRITEPAANGHLLLNPKGVDLRIIPGEIESFVLEKNINTDNNYRAIFLDKSQSIVLRINFESKDDIQETITNIESKKGKLKKINSNSDVEELWRNLTDVHHFYPMLQQLEISKLDAFRSVPDDLAYQVDTHSIWSVLTALQQKKEHFMAFIGNNAVVHVYTGPVLKLVPINNNKIVIHGKTYEGEKAIIKISTKDIEQAWVVNKRSESGYITSLEFFDKDENHIAQFYGVRTEGFKQSEVWNKIITKLPVII
ncbi:MAG: ChuX/HutX family heme-like substrate-binding protein [Plesiomonas sp.]|uniref:ChuX/HutX family heme-like substrate-binding protein n=1 Tax=Plesiomonas sp. TaxID=2486279 RepID=UPI003F3F2408